MTPLTKPLSRRLPAVKVQGRQLVVTLTAHGATIRRERDRASFFYSWMHIYQRAAFLAVQNAIPTRKGARR